MADSTARIRVQTGFIDGTEHFEPGGLAALAADYGIEAEFTDAHGNVRTTTPETKHALLAAMGIQSEGVAQIALARAALAAERWKRALPPVFVTNTRRIDIAIVLPMEQSEIRWRIALEDGSEFSGVLAATGLRLLDERNVDSRQLVRRRLCLEAELPHGYHRLTVDGHSGFAQVICTPGACWLPPAVAAGGRLSGIAIQLYLLRSKKNWGIGDFGDLRTVVELTAARGADVVGLNPLHLMFADNPEHASPYSPASRLLLNVLNIDLNAIPEFAASPEAAAERELPHFISALESCRTADLVDYTAVAALKIDQLRLLFNTFRNAANSERQAEFARYRMHLSPVLERTLIFVALRNHFAANDPAQAAWQHWPAEYRDAASAAVDRFAREHADAISFIAWQQWVADTQLAAAAAAGSAMRVGLYRDLAVGADPGGAETWCNARAVVDAARVGAPPDIYNPAGQNWGLPPFDPHALRAEGYASFIELVRANMRHAGGLRIDHVMALQHLYWIPQGAHPADGAYVQYPLDELVGILALESHRAQCLVVGEDLGTVPAGFRERMERANILSYRVLFFERDDDAHFIAPAAYPPGALAVLGSHDLPTLRAWWDSADIALRARLGLFADAAAIDGQTNARRVEREALVVALRAAGVLAHEAPDSQALFTAAHAFLTQTASALAVAQLDDITDEMDPVNVPTTSDEHPNWRRRMALTIEQLPADPRFTAFFDLCAATGRLRPSA